MKIKKLSFLFILFLVLFVVAACNKNDAQNKLVDLTGKTEAEINEQFNSQGLIVTLDVKEYYVENTTERVFVKYGSDHKVGDEVENGALITIYVSSPSLSLPNLVGLNRTEITEFFSELGVPSTKLAFRGDIARNVVPGTFISYNNINSGTTYDFKSRLTIIYDLSVALPSSEGLNRTQIEKQFNDLSIGVEFEYILDNSKEFDSFASYENFETGSSVSSLDTIIINLYKNDNVNDGDTIANTKQLFISKYVDGKGVNQAIELYNPTTQAINLANYYLVVLANGSLTPTQTINLEGTLEPSKTFVIARNGARESIISKAQLVSSDLVFDGNDTIQLRTKNNDTYIDSIYHVGNVLTTMDEEIFVRKPHITAGNRVFKQNEWWGFIPTFDEVVGTHPTVLPSGPGFELMADKTFQQYGMTLVKLLSVADGDTIYLVSDDPRDTTSYSGDKRIRFLMVDTPETQKPGVVGMPYAQVATQFTRRLLEASTQIYIQADPSAGLTETYGRHLGLIWFHIDEDVTFSNIAKSGDVSIAAGWHLLNYELIKYGLGDKNIAKTSGYDLSPIFSNVYLYQWGEEALNYAMENELGLFSGVDRN